MPWLAIDEVLRIAGWQRNDVDAIALTRGFHPTYHLRVPLWRELRYSVERARGTGRDQRDLAILSRRHGTADTLAIFHAERFLRDSAFRPDAAFYFANHHQSHALPALFFTGWDEALVYTADGIGDNVSYSIRSLSDGLLTCHHGDDRQLLAPSIGNSLAYAYGFATVACDSGWSAMRAS